MTAIDIATARKVLQVPKDATKKDIEKAFRNLSKKLHPDKLSDAKRTAEANERFAEAFNAKDLLLRYLQHLEEEGKVLSSSSCIVMCRMRTHLLLAKKTGSQHQEVHHETKRTNLIPPLIPLKKNGNKKMNLKRHGGKLQKCWLAKKACHTKIH